MKSPIFRNRWTRQDNKDRSFGEVRVFKTRTFNARLQLTHVFNTPQFCYLVPDQEPICIHRDIEGCEGMPIDAARSEYRAFLRHGNSNTNFQVLVKLCAYPKSDPAPPARTDAFAMMMGARREQTEDGRLPVVKSETATSRAPRRLHNKVARHCREHQPEPIRFRRGIKKDDADKMFDKLIGTGLWNLNCIDPRLLAPVPSHLNELGWLAEASVQDGQSKHSTKEFNKALRGETMKVFDELAALELFEGGNMNSLILDLRDLAQRAAQKREESSAAALANKKTNESSSAYERTDASTIIKHVEPTVREWKRALLDSDVLYKEANKKIRCVSRGIAFSSENDI